MAIFCFLRNNLKCNKCLGLNNKSCVMGLLRQLEKRLFVSNKMNVRFT